MRKQMIRHQEFIFFRVFFVIGFLFSLWVSSSAHAEVIDSVGATSSSGAVTINSGVVRDIANGNYSPIQQYIILNQVLINAVKKAQEYRPNYRTPYKIADEKFKTGTCIMEKALWNNWILAELPLIKNHNTTASADQQIAQQFVQSLVAQFSQKNGCDGSSDSGIGSGILAFFGI